MYGIQDSPLYYKEIYNSSNQSITASNGNIAKVNTQKIGHIATLVFDIDVTITKGTGTISGNIVDAINQVTVSDKEGKSILLLTGAQLSRACYVASLTEQRDYPALRRGRYTAVTALADVGTAQNQVIEFPLNVRSDDQPLGIEFTLNTLSSLLSNVGTATAVINVRILAKCYKNPNMPYKTDRLFAFTTISLSTGIKNTLTQNLPKRVLIQAIALQNGNNADSELDYVTLLDNGVGLDRVEDTDVSTFEGADFIQGHLTGFYVLPVTPFSVTDTLDFNLEVGTARAYTIYILHHGSRE